MKSGWQYVNDNGTTEKMAPKTLVENVVVSENGPSLKEIMPSNPNLLINGDFVVCQRETSVLSITQTRYMVDMWEFLFGSGAVHYWQEDVPAEARAVGIVGKKILHLQPRGEFIVCQYLESDLPPGEYTLSFFARVDMGVNYIWGIMDDVRWSTGTGGWVKHIATFNNPSHRNRIGIMRPNGIMPECAVYLADVKLELGSIATTFVPRTYAEELAMCQRYYEKIQNTSSTLPPKILYAISATQCIVLQSWKVRKRAVPTVKVNGCIVGQSVSFRCAEDNSYATGVLSFWNENNLDGLMQVEFSSYSAAFQVGKTYEAAIEADADIY